MGETRKAEAILSTHYDLIFWKIQGHDWQSIAEQVCCAVRVTFLARFLVSGCLCCQHLTAIVPVAHSPAGYMLLIACGL